MMRKVLVPAILGLIAVSCSKDSETSPRSSSEKTSHTPSEKGGQMTAAEWNDLQNWEFFTDLISESGEFSGMPDLWGLYPQNRVSIKLNPLVINSRVELLDANHQVVWSSLSDNFGKAELWINTPEKVNLSSYVIRTSEEETLTIGELGVDANVVMSSAENEITNTSQVLFVVDATSSMADEIEYLKLEIQDVIERTRSNNPGIEFSFGSTFYRDKGDRYITKHQPFTTSTQKMVSFIQDQKAGGGGDYPEAVHTALNESLNQFQWDLKARERIVFLMLDAPPHDEPQVLEQLRNDVKSYAQKGIKIIPITASGIDKKTEFLMRFMAIMTNGTYVFITDDSGIGNEHLQASVGEYEVEFLNDLMLRLITKYVQ